MIWLLKVFVTLILFAIVGCITLIYIPVVGVLALGLDVIWWVWALSLGKVFAGVFPHPSFAKGPDPINLWVLNGPSKLLREIWKYIWGYDGGSANLGNTPGTTTGETDRLGFDSPEDGLIGPRPGLIVQQ
jgi:hypothetical protein